jgi:hypothetical protein
MNYLDLNHNNRCPAKEIAGLRWMRAGRRRHSMMADSLAKKPRRHNPHRVVDLRRHFYISDGRFPADTVEVIGGQFVARDVDGAAVGRFNTLPAAVRALPIRRMP